MRTLFAPLLQKAAPFEFAELASEFGYRDGVLDAILLAHVPARATRRRRILVICPQAIAGFKADDATGIEAGQG